MLRPLLSAGCRRSVLVLSSRSTLLQSRSLLTSTRNSSMSKYVLGERIHFRHHSTTPDSSGEGSSSKSASKPISSPPPSSTGQKPSSTGHSHDNGHDHNHASSCGHDHEHGGLFHTHAHDHSEGAEQIITALKTGKLDRGTKITLLGLGSNVALTVVKGAAGFLMNSASLLAEAGHSLSDLLGDFVTLATWRISRKSPDDRFPWGYSKFETFGTLAVSVILVGGAIGIGLHSYHLLLQVVLPWLESLPEGHALSGLAHWLPSSVPSPLLELFHAHGVGEHDHGHSHIIDHVDPTATALPHEHGALLNPHAAWFALASVMVKEWLYQITNKVAKEENSPVLKANALHHRADALTSLVALGSIVGSSVGGYAWLDPLGGLAVSFFILQQGLSLSKTALMELLDVGIDAKTQKAIENVVDGQVDGKSLLGCRNVRGVKSGGQIQLDLTIVVPAAMTVHDSHAVEVRVRDAIMRARKDTREVKVHVHGHGEPEHATAPVVETLTENVQLTPPAAISEAAAPVTNSDFTRHGCK